MRVAQTAIAVFASVCAACSATGDSPFFDTVSPVAVIDTVPVNGATGVPIDADIELDLSGDLDPVSLEDAFTLTPAADVSLVYEERLARFVLAPNVELALATTYTASVAGARDLRGRPVADYTWTFDTIAPPAPVQSGLMPPPGSVVPGNFVVRAVFSVPIDTTLFDTTPIRVTADAVVVGGLHSYDAPSQTLTFTPAAPVDGVIEVLVDPMTDVYGRPVTITSAGTWTFTADIGVTDVSRPTLSTADAVESGEGGLTVTFGLASDDIWTNAAMRYEVLLTRLAPPTPAGCADPFVPESRRVAIYGSSGTMSIGGLEPGSSWAVTLEAEDGSGRRSLSNGSAGNVTLTIGAPTFASEIEPLLTERCAVACHSGPNPPGYVDYTQSREAILAHESQYQGMPLVTAYCLEESYLWRKLMPGYEIVGQPMPPEDVFASALSRRERELFRIWIQELGGN